MLAKFLHMIIPCVERMTSIDESMFANLLILFNNLITLISVIDIFRRIIDVTMLSLRDFTLDFSELIFVISGVTMLVGIIVRFLVNLNRMKLLGPLSGSIPIESIPNYYAIPENYNVSLIIPPIQRVYNDKTPNCSKFESISSYYYFSLLEP